MTRSVEIVTEYIETAWNLCKSNFYRWNEYMDNSCIRSVSRLFYQSVFDSGVIPTGYTTNPRFFKYEPNNNLTNDHFMSPQTVCKFIMDRPDIVNDFKKFTEVFNLCRRTIVTSREENEILKVNRPRNRNVLTKNRYKHNNIDLYFHGEIINDAFDKLIPDYFTEWEQGFVNNNYYPLVIKDERVPSKKLELWMQ